MPYTTGELAALLAQIRDIAIAIESGFPSLTLGDIFSAVDGCEGDFELAARVLMNLHTRNLAEAATEEAE
jgi:hypothetical protein